MSVQTAAMYFGRWRAIAASSARMAQSNAPRSNLTEGRCTIVDVERLLGRYPPFRRIQPPPLRIGRVPLIPSNGQVRKDVYEPQKLVLRHCGVPEAPRVNRATWNIQPPGKLLYPEVLLCDLNCAGNKRAARKTSHRPREL